MNCIVHSVPYVSAVSSFKVAVYRSITTDSNGNLSDCIDKTRTFDRSTDDYAYVCFTIDIESQDIPLNLKVDYVQNGEIIHTTTDNNAVSSYEYSTYGGSDWEFSVRFNLGLSTSDSIVQANVYANDQFIGSDYFAVNAYPVSLSISGIPEGQSVDYLIDGANAGTISSGTPALMSFSIGSSHTISAAANISISSNERVVCSTCSSQVNSEVVLYFTATRQHLIHLTSDPPGIDLSGTSTDQWVSDGQSPVLTNRIVNGTAGTRYVFTGWRVQGVTRPVSLLPIFSAQTVTATFKTQYYVDVKSDLGPTSGTGWVDENGNTTISTRQEYPATGVLDSLGFKWAFSGWSWNSNDPAPSSPTATFKVISQLTINANWTPTPTIRGLLTIGIVLAAAAGLIVFLLYRRRSGSKEPKTETIPAESTSDIKEKEASNLPSSGTVKHCIMCGSIIPRKAKFCLECGSTQE